VSHEFSVEHTRQRLVILPLYTEAGVETDWKFAPVCLAPFPHSALG
jgi:hypothetical protein